MLEDRFSEQLIRKYPSSSDTVKKTLIVISAVIICLVSLAMSYFIFPGFILLAVGGIWLAWRIISQMYTEYEYTFTNGELDIDKIMAKKTRIEMLSCDVKKFTDFQKVTENMDLSDDDYIRYHLSEGIINHLCFADFDDGNTKSRLYFSPSRETLENIQVFANDEIKKKIQYILDVYYITSDKEEDKND